MWFHTVVCGACGWSFGPTTKKAAKEARHMHLEIHRLEALLAQESADREDPAAPA